MKIPIFFFTFIQIFLGIIFNDANQFIDLEFFEKHAYLFYFICLLLLIIATFFGVLGKGSRRWLNFGGFVFQPSELIKFFIVSLAKFFDEKKIQNTKDYFFLFCLLF